MKTNEWIKSDIYPFYYLTDGKDIFGANEKRDGSMDTDTFEVDYYAFNGKECDEFVEEMINLFGEDAKTLYPVNLFIKQPNTVTHEN